MKEFLFSQDSLKKYFKYGIENLHVTYSRNVFYMLEMKHFFLCLYFSNFTEASASACLGCYNSNNKKPHGCAASKQ